MNRLRPFDLTLTALSLAAVAGSLALRKTDPQAALMPLLSSGVMALASGRQALFPDRGKSDAGPVPILPLVFTAGGAAAFAVCLLAGLNFYACAGVFMFLLPLLLKKGGALKCLIFACAGTLILYLVFGLALGIVFD